MTEVTNDETITKECQECRREAHFLHGLRIDDSDRFLCTSCILRRHPGHFCSVCYTITVTSESSDYVACSKPPCASVAHSDCVGDASAYVCPTCNNASFSFFPLADEDIVYEEHKPPLVCAAKISAENLHKAFVRDLVRAEIKAAEATEARKRAREADQQLQHITERDGAEKKRKEKVDDDTASTAHTSTVTDERDVDIDGGDGDGDTYGGDGEEDVDIDGDDGDEHTDD